MPSFLFFCLIFPAMAYAEQPDELKAAALRHFEGALLLPQEASNKEEGTIWLVATGQEQDRQAFRREPGEGYRLETNCTGGNPLRCN